MTYGSRACVLLLAGLLSVAAACSSGGSGASPTATEDAGPLFDGLTVSEAYATNCAACHGEQRQGLVGPALTPDRLTRGDNTYFEIIAQGRAGTVMPSWRAAGMTDAEIRALVAFIKTEDP